MINNFRFVTAIDYTTHCRNYLPFVRAKDQGQNLSIVYHRWSTASVHHCRSLKGFPRVTGHDRPLFVKAFRLPWVDQAASPASMLFEDELMVLALLVLDGPAPRDVMELEHHQPQLSD